MTAAAGAYQLPRAVTLLGVLVLLYALQRAWPELLPAVLALLALYLATTNANKAAGLVGWLPSRLSTGLARQGVRGSTNTQGK